MRVADIFSRGGPSKATYCEVCNRLTQEGKRFCTDHVEEHPYIQKLMHQLDERDYEELEVERLGPDGVDPQGINVQDILTYLRIYGPRSVERIARDLIMDADLMEHYIAFLAEEGKVTLTRNSRQRTIVRLASKRRNPYRRRRLSRYRPRHYDY